jgi:hypothetical protein
VLSHHENVYPSLVGLAGGVTSVSYSLDIASIDVHPFVLNVIVYEPVLHEGQIFNHVAGIFPSTGTLFHFSTLCHVRTILSGGTMSSPNFNVLSEGLAYLLP